MSAGKEYLTKLKANGLHVFPTNGDTLHALETGQITYGLIQSSAAAGEVAKVKRSAAFEPKVTYLPKTTLLPGVIGIDRPPRLCRRTTSLPQGRTTSRPQLGV